MLDTLCNRLGERRARLFACGCRGMVRHHMTDPRSWDAVVMAERFADGLATEAELDAASVVANDIHLDTEGRVKRYAAEAAFQCAALYEEGWQVLIA